MARVTTSTVALVDDHTLVRQALGHALTEATELDVTVVGQYDDPRAVLDLPTPPDLVLLDLDLGGRAVAVPEVQALMAAGSRVLVVSALGSPATVLAMVGAGVSGFLSKRESTPTLVSAVAAVLAGGTWTTPELAGILASEPGPGPRLSPQEQRVLALYASGMKLDLVAASLGIRPGTARQYLERIRAKYDAAGRAVHSRADMYQQAVHDGLLQPPL